MRVLTLPRSAWCGGRPLWPPPASRTRLEGLVFRDAALRGRRFSGPTGGTAGRSRNRSREAITQGVVLWCSRLSWCAGCGAKPRRHSGCSFERVVEGLQTLRGRSTEEDW